MDYTNIFITGYNFIFEQCQFDTLKDSKKMKKLVKMSKLLCNTGYRNKKSIQRKYNSDYMLQKLYRFYMYNFDYQFMEV